ncbi:hypothetical protein SpCBS45565_g01409 [Spizellomyces sp. 'palustris']|nr:hypothetical protein SpCBS45565_g01409 [Spizellomyces sp. 'palustris']
MVAITQPNFYERNLPFIVYGKHNFNAEEEDEISFNASEPVVVLERDELYNDGWWRGRNVRGLVGLFPMNFVMDEPAAGLSSANMNHIHVSQYEMSYDEPARAPSTPLPPVPNEESQPVQGASFNKDTNQITEEPSVTEESHPITWNVEQVGQWLDESGFPFAVSIFTERQVNGEKLLELNLSSLRQLGLESLGDRINILHSILALKEDFANTPTELPAPAQSLPAAREDKRSQESLSVRTSITIKSPSNVPSQDSGFAEDEEVGTFAQNVEQKWSYRVHNPDDEREKEERLRRTVSYFTLSDYLYDTGDSPESPEESPVASTDIPLSPNPLSTEEAESSDSDEEVQETAPGSRSVGGMVGQPSEPTSESSLEDVRSPTSPMSVTSPTSPTSPKEHEPNFLHFLAKSRSDFRGLARNLTRGHRRSKHSITQSVDLDRQFPNPDHAGWLHVRVGHAKGWKKRWCVLDAGILHILKGQNNPLVVADIPIGHNYTILPDANSAHARFAFMAMHRDAPTIHFSADTQLAMVSWINVMVRAGQHKGRAGPVPLIPIKNNDRLSRIPISGSFERLSLHSHPSLSSLSNVAKNPKFFSERRGTSGANRLSVASSSGAGSSDSGDRPVGAGPGMFGLAEPGRTAASWSVPHVRSM